MEDEGGNTRCWVFRKSSSSNDLCNIFSLSSADYDQVSLSYCKTKEYFSTSLTAVGFHFGNILGTLCTRIR